MTSNFVNYFVLIVFYYLFIFTVTELFNLFDCICFALSFLYYDCVQDMVWLRAMCATYGHLLYYDCVRDMAVLTILVSMLSDTGVSVK